jgi:hypothetical protein
LGDVLFRRHAYQAGVWRAAEHIASFVHFGEATLDAALAHDVADLAGSAIFVLATLDQVIGEGPLALSQRQSQQCEPETHSDRP